MRSIEGACFLAWRDAGRGDAICVGELHFSNASHVKRPEAQARLFGVVFQLLSCSGGTYDFEGGDPWRLVDLHATAVAELRPARGGGFALANEAALTTRLAELPEQQLGWRAVSEEQPSDVDVVGAAFAHAPAASCADLPRVAPQRAWTRCLLRARAAQARRVRSVTARAHMRTSLMLVVTLHRLGLEPHPRG